MKELQNRVYSRKVTLEFMGFRSLEGRIREGLEGVTEIKRIDNSGRLYDT